MTSEAVQACIRTTVKAVLAVGLVAGAIYAAIWVPESKLDILASLAGVAVAHYFKEGPSG